MATTVYLALWGSSMESRPVYVREQSDLQETVRQALQQALAHRYPMAHICDFRMSREERLVDGLLCMGHRVMLAVAFSLQPDMTPTPQELESRMEDLVSVALLRQFCPVHVDVVTAI